MTAKTPVFGIEYLVQGEPARATRLALENNAKTVEAALLRGGVAPAGATDLATLAGNVLPTPWQTMPLAAGWGSYSQSPGVGDDFAPPSYRRENGRVWFQGWLTTTAAIAGGTSVMIGHYLPTGFRPVRHHTMFANDASTGLAGVRWRLEIYPDGRLFPFGNVASGTSMSLHSLSFPIG